MAYTEKFQLVLNELDKMVSQGKPISALQTYFFDEMVKLGPKERINNLYKVRPKRAVPGEKSRYVNFRMNRVQDNYYDNRTYRDSILKMRQVGTTTLSCVIGLDSCLFNNGYNACIMAHVLSNVKKYFRITKNAFTQFQRDWGNLYPVTNIVDNVSELHIGETGSIMMVATETKGLTLDFLHVAEAAFVEDDRIQESMESVPLTGHIILESTADGAAGIFYDVWDAFLKNEKDSLFTCHFYPWWEHYPEPEDVEVIKYFKNKLKVNGELVITDEEQQLIDKYELSKDHIVFRKLKISEAGGSESEFFKKYPEDPITCFLSGAHSVFDADIVRSLWVNSIPESFKGDLQIV